LSNHQGARIGLEREDTRCRRGGGWGKRRRYPRRSRGHASCRW
jgi:hypothetical protein